MIIHHSSMAYRSVQLLDLPDELLLIILGNLHRVDKLYSLEGMNKRLGKMYIILKGEQTDFLISVDFQLISRIEISLFHLG